MKYLVNPSTDPHYNMAFDEYALESLPLEEPLFYLWRNRPSVIIGLSQNAFAEVNMDYLRSRDISLARRVTGGGAVYHDLQNLNYTLVGRSRDLDRDYPDYLNFIVEALRSLGVPAALTGRNDILVDGRKCSGYAKRVFKDRLMVHGTLMFDVDLEKLTRALAVPGSKLSAAGVASVRSRVANLREYLPQCPDIQAFQMALGGILAAEDGPYAPERPSLSPEQEADVVRLSDKFRSWEWIYGRSPQATFRTCRKLACGTVEAHFSVEHGRVSELAFRGDFLGNLPAGELAARLIGTRYERAALLEAAASCGDYLDGVTPAELAALLLEG